MNQAIKLGVFGAAGRMGRRVVAFAQADDRFEVVNAYEAPGHPMLGQDAGELAGVGAIGVLLQDEIGSPVDVIIDFSVPEGAVTVAEVCGARRIPLVEATTGLTAEQKEKVLAASQNSALLMAPSMSLAVNLCMKLAEAAGDALKDLPSGVDVEIIERHHRFKEDAPSGTALRFGEIIAAKMGQTSHVHGREGRVGMRPRSEIGYHALRTGDNVGEHTVVFGLMGETIELTVRSHSRDAYASGALAAAAFIITQGAGLYSMADVLGHVAV